MIGIIHFTCNKDSSVTWKLFLISREDDICEDAILSQLIEAGEHLHGMARIVKLIVIRCTFYILLISSFRDFWSLYRRGDAHQGL